MNTSRFEQTLWTVLLRKLSLILMLILSLASLSPSVYAADGADMTRARIETSEDGYRLSAAFSFELNRGLEDAINRGVPLYFTTEVELTRPRWYWFDEKAINATQTIRISYNVLTRRYQAAINGSLQQSFDSLDDALSLIRRPSRWIIADKGALQVGEIYRVAVRMGLDLAQLPKPFQVNALNNSDWRLSSDWKTFNYKAE
ncbi:DUF4390 domain-containing protein [Glaciimonas sp. PAMC28666]|nr:DUF4390 domain-containing protein [Glaciimonas sp. PAMC28666]